ncbi:MAG TPA: hypothetical protein ENN07_03145, partial [candidate division Zixibacteria bacterium]|nr:hypothetical protein [candidate division Zixibacteria bacterium]
MNYKAVLLLCCFIPLAIVGQARIDPQTLSPEMQQQYERYLRQRQTPMVSEELPAYETPPIFDPQDTLLFELEEFRIREVVDEVEEEFFFDRVIIDGDTVQSIRKAMPRDLKFFGSEFFAPRREKTITAAPVSDDYVLGIGDNILVSLW